MSDNKKKSNKWLASGVKCKDEIEKLAALASSWNFENSEYCTMVSSQRSYLSTE